MPIGVEGGAAIGNSIGDSFFPPERPQSNAQTLSYMYSMRKELLSKGMGVYYDPAKPEGEKWAIADDPLYKNLTPMEIEFAKHSHMQTQQAAYTKQIDLANKIAKSQSSLIQDAFKIWDKEGPTTDVKLRSIEMYQNTLKQSMGEDIWKGVGVDLSKMFGDLKSSSDLKEAVGIQAANLLQSAEAEYKKKPTLDNLLKYRSLYSLHSDIASEKAFPKPQALEDKYFHDAKKEKESHAKETFAGESRLRDAFTKGSSDFIKVRDSYERVKASTEDPSPAGDLALIFNYMKMLDPGSVVRESEYATASNTGSVPERVRAQYNRVLNGEKLSDTMRDDFINRSNKLYDRQLRSHKKLAKEYRELSRRYGLSPENVVIDYVLDGEGEKQKVEYDYEYIPGKGLVRVNK